MKAATPGGAAAFLLNVERGDRKRRLRSTEVLHDEPRRRPEVTARCHCIVRGAEEVDRTALPESTREVTVPTPVQVPDGTYQLVLTVSHWYGVKLTRLRLIRLSWPQEEVKVLSTVYRCLDDEQFWMSVKTPTGHPTEAALILRLVLDVAHPPADAGVDSSVNPARAAMPSMTMAFNEFLDI